VDEPGFGGKTALVTGGASGIGRATVLKLVGAGCRTAVLDRDEDGLARLVGEVGADRCIAVVADLAERSDRRAVREAIERRRDRYRRQQRAWVSRRRRRRRSSSGPDLAINVWALSSSARRSSRRCSNGAPA
jgi:NAD(P)-dependent dehydrogenase (short-subunit alcohol dehydrogenase family)